MAFTFNVFGQIPLPPPYDLTATVYEEDVVLQWYPPDDRLERSIANTRDVPENLLGYNLYKNDALFTYLAHSSQNEIQLYIDTNNWPGFYDYELSAVYDLAPFGLPGDTGESIRIGPVQAIVDYCSPLTLSENWDSGNFNANQWTTEGAGWFVSSDTGNPLPCARFSPDPAISDYNSVLMSFPLCGIDLTEGQIWLDYDVCLLSNQSTGNEKLTVEIWNWSSEEWIPVQEHSNVIGSFSWFDEHINISRISKGEVFRLRFVASGSNSADIESWLIDNIEVYRYCLPPVNLTATADLEDSTIILEWEILSVSPLDQWISWSNDTVNNSFGTGEAVEFDVAHRWGPAQLFELYGGSVTEVAIMPAESLCSYNLRIWTGENADSLVYDEFVENPEIGEWNYIMLSPPVLINTEEDLWIGYHVNAQTGYPAGTDSGPAVNGYGNMIYWSGAWQTLLEVNPGLDMNFGIKAHVENVYEKKEICPAKRAENDNPDSDRDLVGFNIYRSVNSGEYILLEYNTGGAYSEDEDLPNNLYCYMVNAFYQSEIDICESGFSNEACAILNVGVQNPDDALTELDVYPNPARDLLNISSSFLIDQLILYDLNGRIILEIPVENNSSKIKMYDLNNGIYILKVISENEPVYKKIVVDR